MSYPQHRAISHSGPEIDPGRAFPRSPLNRSHKNLNNKVIFMTTNPLNDMINRVVNDGEARRARAARTLRGYLGLDPDSRPSNAENLIDIIEDRMRGGQFYGDIPASAFEKAQAEIFEQIQEIARTPEAYAHSMPHPLGREIPKGVWLKGGRGLAEDLLASDFRVSLVMPDQNKSFQDFFISVDAGIAVSRCLKERQKAA